MVRPMSGANEVEQRSKKSRKTIIIQKEDNNNLNIENNKEIGESEKSEEDLFRYFSDKNIEEAANNQLSNLEYFTNISENNINQLEIKKEFNTRLTDVIGKGDWYKPILQSVMFSIYVHSKYLSLKDFKENVLNGFYNESHRSKSEKSGTNRSPIR
ncbi:hypothetical protein RhiirA4_479703 [Rhizophagus irregularis]|uniref:Uncharacterized protein n=1 Tax=Rhizophagus irregularis TaxID=588596 RepID=A0A2I1HGT9_9GLOM|nr:hypothetical protein RhiirA4_479703 [Rhizophagus irregularis]